MFPVMTVITANIVKAWDPSSTQSSDSDSDCTTTVTSTYTPTYTYTSSGQQTWATWSTTSSSKPVDPTSSSSWSVWPSSKPSNVYITSTTTVYIDVGPTGFARTTATVTATVTVTDSVSQATGKDAAWPTNSSGIPTGFYATAKVCDSGCAATPVTVVVTIPLPTGAITKTVVPTAVTPAAESGKTSSAGSGTAVAATSGSASTTSTDSAWTTGNPIGGYSGVNGVKTYTGGAAADQAPATALSVAVCLFLAVAGLIL